ncbi:MAG: S1 RNA-binding domain-containing protein, partial [Candidatus Margulisbacteria bacterium]|nr:S1 RNA-binding domain-containing protein [Candidatus Margulisiibacteriota bacterium]
MSEGTKIGQFVGVDFKNSTDADQNSEELKGTKIGEISDFEKSLPAKETNKEESTSSTTGDNEDPESTPESQEEDISTEALFQSELEKTIKDYEVGDIVKGIVRRIEKMGVLVDIQYKSDGLIPSSEFNTDTGLTPQDLEEGDAIESMIVKIETKEGYTELSRKRAEYEISWNDVSSASKLKTLIDVKVISSVEGGLVVHFKGLKGFIPASHCIRSGDEKLEDFVGQTLSVAVLQVDRKRRKIIFSNKIARSKPSQIDVKKALEEIEIGDVKEGKVTSIKEFGAFVDIGGVEGLVHISEMSWSRINHPSDIIAIGDQIKVFVLGVDKDNSRISLGIKQLQPDPWVKVSENYHLGQIVDGVITRIVTFGAFIEIEKDLEGLIHISELSESHVKSVEDVLTLGEKIKAKIIKLLPDEQRIGLSFRGMEENPIETSVAQPEEVPQEDTPQEEVPQEDT